ncbi:MAG: hypothetical protein FWC38_10165 [Proteobacteria bacterium]|nr:hypothetical protein [Pseudomonadota bacterium]
MNRKESGIRGQGSGIRDQGSEMRHCERSEAIQRFPVAHIFWIASLRSQ